MVIENEFQAIAGIQTEDVSIDCYVWTVLAQALAKVSFQQDLSAKPVQIDVFPDQDDVFLEKQELPMQIASSMGSFVSLMAAPLAVKLPLGFGYGRIRVSFHAPRAVTSGKSPALRETAPAHAP